MSMIDFPGASLRARREARGLSLLDVYAHVRVPVQYIEAMEQGRIHELPVKTYVFGFIRTYCEFLGLDPEPYIDNYRTCTQTRHAASRFLPNTVSVQAGRRPRWMTELIAWGAICGILVLSWFTFNVVVRPLFIDSEPRVDAGTHEIPANDTLNENF
jgi:cytoskeleton protein RodZ